ncbi:MAG: TlpA family protein disulfide reductase [Methylotenera sp.]|nr:TlpA family protein disulfide reductase [Methylotenera sp.]
MMKYLLSRLLFLLALVASTSVFADVAITKNFLLKDMQGKSHQLSQYKGKWVLVNYWATWCPPCLEEIPDLVNLYDQRKNQDLMVLGVVFDYKQIKEVTDYVDDMLISYPIILGDNQAVYQIGSAQALPTTYLYNPNGELVKVKRGVVTKQLIERWLGVAKQ